MAPHEPGHEARNLTRDPASRIIHGVSLVSRSGRIFAVGAWALLVGQAVVSCSSNGARPAELGDCVKTGDASCPVPDPGGGGGGGPGGGDSGAVGDTGVVPSGCGTAQNLLAAQNTSCAPCVDGTNEAGSDNCCGADTACSAQSACLELLQCMVGCSSTDVTCQNTCENTNPNGVTAYNEFASCLAQNCTPECPTLPTGGTGDL